MTVRVDELRVWPTRIRCFKGGSCHLSADTLDELHAFAARLGLRRAWFQPHPIMSHYDLTPAKRELAVALGAVEVSAREQAESRIAARARASAVHWRLCAGWSPQSQQNEALRTQTKCRRRVAAEQIVDDVAAVTCKACRKSGGE